MCPEVVVEVVDDVRCIVGNLLIHPVELLKEMRGEEGLGHAFKVHDPSCTTLLILLNAIEDEVRDAKACLLHESVMKM